MGRRRNLDVRLEQAPNDCSLSSIKAKSIKGYKCRNYKMTSNKFMLEEAKPELLDDWDPR